MCLVFQVVTANKECKGDNGKSCGCAEPSQGHQPASQLQPLPGKVLYGSQKGTAAAFAKQLARQAATFGVELQAVDLKDYEVEQLWKEHLVLLVLSTYENGSPPDSARYTGRWLSILSSNPSACSVTMITEEITALWIVFSMVYFLRQNALQLTLLTEPGLACIA